MAMSLAEFLERLEADPFDPKLVELVEHGFYVVAGRTRAPEAKEKKPCNS